MPADPLAAALALLADADDYAEIHCGTDPGCPCPEFPDCPVARFRAANPKE